MTRYIVDIPRGWKPACRLEDKWNPIYAVDDVYYCGECGLWDCIDNDDDPIRRGICAEWTSRCRKGKIITMDDDFCSHGIPID